MPRGRSLPAAATRAAAADAAGAAWPRNSPPVLQIAWQTALAGLAPRIACTVGPQRRCSAPGHAGLPTGAWLTLLRAELRLPMSLVAAVGAAAWRPSCPSQLAVVTPVRSDPGAPGTTQCPHHDRRRTASGREPAPFARRCGPPADGPPCHVPPVGGSTVRLLRAAPAGPRPGSPAG